MITPSAKKSRYTCSRAPVTNVAVEILCDLVKGKTLDEAAGVTEQAFDRVLGSEDEDLREKARGLLELLKRGVSRYGSRRQPDGCPETPLLQK